MGLHGYAQTQSKINSPHCEIHYSYNGPPSWIQKPTNLLLRTARKETTRHTYNTVINSSLERDCNGNCHTGITTSPLRMCNIDRYRCLQSTSKGYVHQKCNFKQQRAVHFAINIHCTQIMLNTTTCCKPSRHKNWSRFRHYLLSRCKAQYQQKDIGVVPYSSVLLSSSSMAAHNTLFCWRVPAHLWQVAR